MTDAPQSPALSPAPHDRIIALVDGSPYAPSVCHHAAWAARRIGAPVELVHVLDMRETPDHLDLSGAIELGARTKLLEELAELDARRARLLAEHGRAILDDAREIVRADGVDEVLTRLRRGDITQALAALEPEARIIVIGKRGQNAEPDSPRLGSNLERIVRATHRPVLVAARAFRPIKRVLVAHDGRAAAQEALALIAESPICAGLEITVVTVGEDSPETRARLDEARATLARAGIEAQTRIVPGAPDQALGALVEHEGYDLVVMGAYGHSRLRALVIGSTTTAMIRSCKAPLLLVH